MRLIITSFLGLFIGVGALAQDDTDTVKATKLLASPDAAVRAKAVDELGRSGNNVKLVIPALSGALEDSAKDVRWRAARSLAGLGSHAADAVPALLKALSDEEPYVRAYAAYALGAIGEPAQRAVPDLVKAAPDEDPMVRRAVFQALRRVRAPQEATRVLVMKMLDQADPELISGMMQTFVEGGEQVVPILNESLRNDKTSYWAAMALREIGPKAKGAAESLGEVLLKSDEPEVRMQAALALAAIGPAAKSAVKTLAQALRDDEVGGVKFAAAYALGEIGERQGALEALEYAANSDDNFLAMISAWSLARLEPEDKLRTEKAIKLLIAGLQSPNPQHRSAAARAMVQFKGQSAAIAPALVAALKDSSREVIGNALEALTAGGEQVVPAVVAGLRDEDLRMYSVRVLSRLGPDAKSAVPDLVKALRVDDPDFKREVQFALGVIGPPAAPAVPELVKSLSSADEGVRNSAIFAVGKIGPEAKEALSALRKDLATDDRTLRRLSVWAMLKIDKENVALAKAAVPLLAESLVHETEIVRYEAAIALGEIGKLAAPALPALKKSLSDSSLHVRDAAAEAIKKIEN